MQILCSGHHNSHFITITDYIEQAIKSLGHAVITFEDRCHILPGRLRNRIKRLDKFDNSYINKKFVSFALRNMPDIALIGGGNRIGRHSIQTLNEKGISTVLWTTDPPKNFQEILEVAPEYKHIFCQGSEATELFEKNDIKNSHFLPMACDPVYHFPVDIDAKDKKKYGHDMVFVGSYYPSRLALFEKIANFDLAIWGPGWDRLKGNPNLRLAIKGTHTTPSEWVKIYSACKIVLAPHYEEESKLFPVYQASPRVFEAMACGALVFSDHQKDVFSIFKDGEHLVGFRTLEELLKKINYYLHHPEEREKIANCGRQEVLKKHKYVNRLEKLLSIVGQKQA